ncbi:hypothetical protein HME9302_00515 [Alteripontixanthobacter maritimus]|uniref:Bacterial dipeptidyl-peptidase SH3 domain-containing protein n=1 Tax=Alteripontixanthobacter maritimus TaxID=2161824 RepID=A0A369QAM4_9SPHN|nr:hypothetical protein [Alteripontixanthobacter maritimus]RDC59328.1 hypothetical protein HME9302_00515 [Alteripontixanthobacter maritimus]
MTDASDYSPPEGGVRLSGPVVRPEPGTLPLRGDLAHIALASRFLVPHYAVPQAYRVGDDGAPLKLKRTGDSDTLREMAAGEQFEALDFAGDWCWGCCGPEGPTGWIETRLLAASTTSGK